MHTHARIHTHTRTHTHIHDSLTLYIVRNLGDQKYIRCDAHGHFFAAGRWVNALWNDAHEDVIVSRGIKRDGCSVLMNVASLRRMHAHGGGGEGAHLLDTFGGGGWGGRDATRAEGGLAGTVGS